MLTGKAHAAESHQNRQSSRALEAGGLPGASVDCASFLHWSRGASNWGLSGRVVAPLDVGLSPLGAGPTAEPASSSLSIGGGLGSADASSTSSTSIPSSSAVAGTNQMAAIILVVAEFLDDGGGGHPPGSLDLLGLVLVVEVFFQHADVLGVCFPIGIGNVAEDGDDADAKVDADVEQHGDEDGGGEATVDFGAAPYKQESEEGIHYVTGTGDELLVIFHFLAWLEYRNEDGDVRRDDANDGAPAKADAEESEQGHVQSV